MIDCNDHDLQHRPQCSLWPRFWTMASFTQATLHQCGCFIVESFSFSTASWETCCPHHWRTCTHNHIKGLSFRRWGSILFFHGIEYHGTTQIWDSAARSRPWEMDSWKIVSLLIVYFTALNWTSGQNNLLSILIVYFMSLNWTSSHSFEHDFFHMDS